MLSFNNILVAVDGSEFAMKAVETAVELEASGDASLHVLSVYPHLSMFESSHSLIRPRQPIPHPDETFRQLARECVDLAMKRAKDMGATGVKGVVRRGKPARTILEYAEEIGADCLVIGGRGLGDVGPGTLGSTAQKVASRARCTVVIVR